MKERAKEIRNEIKEMIKKGQLPKIKVSVTSSYNQIRAEIKEVPIGFEIINPEFVKTNDWRIGRYTTQGKEVIEKIENLVNKGKKCLNADDVYADYHYSNFYTNICFDYKLERKAWQA